MVCVRKRKKRKKRKKGGIRKERDEKGEKAREKEGEKREKEMDKKREKKEREKERIEEIHLLGNLTVGLEAKKVFSLRKYEIGIQRNRNYVGNARKWFLLTTVLSKLVPCCLSS